MPASRARSADRTSRTWTGPAACRNVPQVVATGKARLVTRNVTRPRRTTGRTARSRPCHGSAANPISEIGTPGRSSTENRLWARPSTSHLEEPGGPDREVAGERRRIVPGEDVEARHRQRVRGRLSGQRAAEDHPVAPRPWREHEERDDSGQADQPDALDPGRRRREPGHHRPGQPDPDRLVARQRRQADERPQADHPQVGQTRPAWVARDPRHQQARGQGQHRERHRRVRQGGMEEERQVDRGRQARAEGQGPGSSDRQTAFLRDVGGKAPGEDRHERPDDDRRDLGGLERRTDDGHRDRGEERRQRQPHLERRPREHERRRLEAPQGVRHEAAAVQQVACHADVVGGVLGLGEHDLRGEERARHERYDEDQRDGQPHLAPGHAAPPVAAQRTSAGSRQTGYTPTPKRSSSPVAPVRGSV